MGLLRNGGEIMSKRKKHHISQWVYHIGMFAFAFAMIYPLIWMVVSSFKPNSDIFATATSLLPRNATLEHYSSGWKGFAGYTFTTFFGNSIFVAALSIIGTLFSSVTVAFGFARLQFKGKNFWFVLMMLTMMLPSQVLMIPTFLIYNRLGMVGTMLPLFLPNFFGNAFNIFMVMQFIRGIPKDMDDAARIDGCSWYGILSRIHLPMIKPCMATVAILTFMGSWQDFMGALLYLSSPRQYTVAYALKLFNDSSGNDYGATFAMSTISLIPILVLFFLFQKQLVEGISIQGLKG